MDVIEQIKATIAENPILLFMKGSPEMPQCGFSMRTAEALKACNKEFAYVDIMANQEIRSNLPQISNWPTFPQVFINGELVGGCDIVLDLYQKGELQTMVESVGTPED